MQVLKTLNSNRAEAYIGTGIKIIIAVVVGALILGGVYLLFAGRNGVITNVNQSIQSMMNYEKEPVECQYDTVTAHLTSLQYTYDGETWIAAKVPTYSEDAVIVKYYDNSATEAPASLAVVNDNNTIYMLTSADNGATWVESKNFGTVNTTDRIISYSLSYSEKSGFYFIIKSMKPTGGGWGNDYSSTDGVKWSPYSLGIHYF